MEAAIGLVAFIGGLAAINWVIHAFLDWIPELARRGRRRRPGGGTRRLRPHPTPNGHPTGNVGPSRPAEGKRPERVR